MTPKEKREAADKILDDTMTVSQAKKRKLELRDKDLKIRAASLERKKKNDADAKSRRAKAAADKKAKAAKSAADKEAAAKAAAQEKKNKEGTAAVIARKKRKDASEKRKLDNIKGIASKRKAGVDKSLSRAKEVAKKGRGKTNISKDEGEASAELKVMKGAAKGAIAAGRAGFNLGKAAAKGVGAGIAGAKARKAQGKADAKQKKIDDRNDKLDKAKDKKVKDRLNRRRMSKLKKMNPFQKEKRHERRTNPARD